MFAWKFVPLSVSIWSGNPNVNIVLSILFATISAIADGMAWTSAHLVKWSIITSMYLFPFLVIGNGPALSEVIVWNGWSET